MVAGPEIVRVLQEFEAQALLVSDSTNDMKHHEQTPAIQKRCMNDVTKLVQDFEDFEHGNQFTETTANDLLALDTRMLADHTMHRTVKAAHDIGISQLQKLLMSDLNDLFQCMILYLVINCHSLHSNHNPKNMILTD